MEEGVRRLNELESILTSVKKKLGIAEDYKAYDPDLIIDINSVFMVLNQLGVGPEGFTINDEGAVWADFLKDNNKLELVKSYMVLKVKMMFDPPSGSTVLDAYNKMIAEFEFRLQVSAENQGLKPDEPDEYTGEYEVTLKTFDAQVLQTANKLLSDDITVKKVPYSETSNKADGKTVYIGQEV